MRIIPTLVLAATVLAACATPTANALPTSMPGSPATLVPAAVAPTNMPTVVPTISLSETPEPSAIPTPVATATASPVPERTVFSQAVWEPFDVAAQAAALLPTTRGDLDRAGEWNRYTIRGTIDPARRTLSASQRLEYTNRDSVALDKLYFHLYPNLSDFVGRLDVTNLAVNGTPVPVAYQLNRYLLRVDLPQPLEPGAEAVVTLDFVARTPVNASGPAYGAFNREAGVLALASAYPIAAVVRGGVWDIERPDAKGDFVNSETSLYDVTLSAPADWNLVTTGVAINEQIEGANRNTRFVSGPQRDFTLAATQLQQVSGEVEGTRVTSYYRSNNAAGGKIALDVAINSVRAYNKRFGPYPLRELDVIEIAATRFLGVEYPGLTMIDSKIYGDARTLETTVVHEVAHMWFYSTVGNDVQRESWLDEAFASYAQIIYGEEVFGAGRAAEELAEFRRRYANVVQAGRDAPVSQQNRTFKSNYFGLVYGKAVLFLQVLRNELGEEAFDRFLHDYYAENRYRYVSGSDLLASAEEACGCQLDTLYQNWIVKKAPVKVP